MMNGVALKAPVRFQSVATLHVAGVTAHDVFRPEDHFQTGRMPYAVVGEAFAREAQGVALRDIGTGVVPIWDGTFEGENLESVLDELHDRFHSIELSDLHQLCEAICRPGKIRGEVMGKTIYGAVSVRGENLFIELNCDWVRQPNGIVIDAVEPFPLPAGALLFGAKV